MAETAMSNVMLESAGYDVGAYFALVQRTDIHDSILGFHAQQGLEKALKAALFKHSVFVPKTHSLGHLLQALSDANVEAPPQPTQSTHSIPTPYRRATGHSATAHCTGSPWGHG